MMYSRPRLAQKYLRYYLSAANGKGHGIHSPFVFDFVQSVLNDRAKHPEWSSIEALRQRLSQDPTELEIEDLGAGSALQATRHRSIGEITRHAAKPPRLGQLLFRVANHYQPRRILELGTSLGLSTAYLATGAPEAKCWTIEGAGPVAAIAAKNFHSLGLENVEGIRGNFDEVLDPLLEKTGPIDLAFIDGNHRREPTLRYFDRLMGCAGKAATLIFDDIHWSAEMEEAWALIKEDPRVYLTVDLFFVGFVFIRDEFKVKQHFTIRF